MSVAAEAIARLSACRSCSYGAPPGLQVGANAAELIPVGACRAVFVGAVLAAAML